MDEHWLVLIMYPSGENTSKIQVKEHFIESVILFSDLIKLNHSNTIVDNSINYMMKIRLYRSAITIFLQVNFTALKLFAYYVALLLHGPSSIKLNLLPIFSIG